MRKDRTTRSEYEANISVTKARWGSTNKAKGQSVITSCNGNCKSQLTVRESERDKAEDSRRARVKGRSQSGRLGLASKVN